MKITIDDLPIEIDDKELESRYLDEGNESTVYEYYNVVLKIYKKFCNKDRLTKEEVEFLRRIRTKRILLPANIIYDQDHSFIGYTLKQILSYSLKSICRMKVKNLKKELELIREDIRILSENGISLEDFHYDNLLFDGNIYLIDPGNYKVVEGTKEEIYKENIKLFNTFFLRDILFRIIRLTKAQKANLEILTDSEGFVGDIIEPSEKNVSAYISGLSNSR